jgi:beta-phosphoglucomutase-like phosphatase (HAD superfamily)
VHREDAVRYPERERKKRERCTDRLTSVSSSFVFHHWSLESILYCAASGEVETRPGILELFDEARDAGLKVGVCSAATKSSAVCVLENLLGAHRFKVCTVHLHQCIKVR